MLLVCARKTALKDDSAARSLVLHPENFASATEKNVIPNFSHRLSLTLHKIC